MKNKLLLVSSILLASPGVAMYVLGGNSIIQAFGLVIIVISSLIVPIGFFSKSGVAKFAWLSFAVVLLILILASGYVPVASNYSLGFSSNLISIVAILVVLAEIGLITSMMFGNYTAYSKELKKAGYFENEFELELGSFNKFIILLILVSLGLSLGIYFLFANLPSFGIDTLSAFVISAIIYFVIARYIMMQRKVQKMV